MSSDVPEYVSTFIDFNKNTLKNIYEAGCNAESEGILMIEINITENDSKVYFVGEQRWNEMNKGDFYNEMKEKIPMDKKDEMILYIMDRSEDKVHLLLINKE